ncbi:MAG TPA: GDP-mannose 4,6-dehydratase, partial [Lysobacter sp.]
DYATPDGTCVRDYVHVDDLADAHSRALDFMADHEGAHAFNLGNGAGFSVLEMIHAAAEVARRPIPFEIAPRRAGDPDRLVAASAKARSELGWQPRYTDIAQIIDTAWRWHRNPRY